MARTKSTASKRWSSRHRRKAPQLILQRSWTCATFRKKKKKNSDWATRSKIHRRRSCTTWRRCERWLRLVCGFHRAGILRVTHVRRQCSGCDFQTSRMRRTSKWCSVCQYSGKIGGCSKIAQNSEIWVSSFLNASSTTLMFKIMGKHWRSCGTSWTKLVWSSICWIAMGKTIRASFIRTWMGESPELGMYVRSMETRAFLSDKCGWHQNVRKEAESGSHVEEIDEETLILTNQTHFLITCVRDALRVNANRLKLSLNDVQKCSYHVFLMEEQRKYRDGKNLKHIQWRGPTTWKDMLRNVLNDTAKWQTRK